jgi:hypothetical protein
VTGGRADPVTDWATVAQVGTAAGTLVLAAATFASVRSANRSTRLAERSLLTQLRPLLLPSRLEDPPEKVGFQDDHWVRVAGGRAVAEVAGEAIYLAMTLRNVGTGLAVLNRWQLHAGRMIGVSDQPDVDGFRRLTRDLYISAGDRGFWQGTYRDPSDPAFAEAVDVIKRREAFTIDMLYGDAEGTQHILTRFVVVPASKEDTWVTSVSRHWNLDRPNPR